MKNFLKTVGILALVLIGIIALYIVACGSVVAEISAFPQTSPAQYITDFTLLEEKSYEISEGDISMKIPTSYATTNLRDYYMIFGESKSTKSTICVYYKPLQHVAGKLGLENEFKEYLDAIKLLEEDKPDYPINLFFDIPDDIFELYKKVSTADKNNFKFWNLASALETSYYLGTRQTLQDNGINIFAIYERDNVRATIFNNSELENYYIVMLHKNNLANDTYLFAVETTELDEIIKILNSFEYKTGLGF